jgi:hypothetical protein
MQTINNLIFSAVATGATATYGMWRDVSNFVDMSIFVTGLETGSDVWIEISNDPDVMWDGPGIGAPAAPTLSQTTPQYSAGYNNPSTSVATTYSVKVTYVNPQGESTASPASSLLVSAGNILVVSSPANVTGNYASAYNVYVSIGGGAYVLQNPLYNSQPAHGNLQAGNGPITIGRPFFLFAYQNTQIQPPATDGTGSPNLGVNAIPGNGGNLVGYTPDSNAPIAILYDTNNGGEAMWAPSSMYWNWVRVGKKDGTSVTTNAWLFGQNG